MPHQLDLYSFELPAIEDWLAGDNRVLDFVVTDADGNAIDISNATVSWSLFDRAYQNDPANAIISGDDADVEIVTDTRVDTTAGEFEVRLDSSATESLYGEYWHRPVVEQSDGSTAKWRGRAILTA